MDVVLCSQFYKFRFRFFFFFRTFVIKVSVRHRSYFCFPSKHERIPTPPTSLSGRLTISLAPERSQTRGKKRLRPLQERKGPSSHAKSLETPGAPLGPGVALQGPREGRGPRRAQAHGSCRRVSPRSLKCCEALRSSSADIASFTGVSGSLPAPAPWEGLRRGASSGREPGCAVGGRSRRGRVEGAPAPAASPAEAPSPAPRPPPEGKAGVPSDHVSPRVGGVKGVEGPPRAVCTPRGGPSTRTQERRAAFVLGADGPRGAGGLHGPSPSPPASQRPHPTAARRKVAAWTLFVWPPAPTAPRALCCSKTDLAPPGFGPQRRFQPLPLLRWGRRQLYRKNFKI